jgi:hypothetical protein
MEGSEWGLIFGLGCCAGWTSLLLVVVTLLLWLVRGLAS